MPYETKAKWLTLVKLLTDADAKTDAYSGYDATGVA